VQIFRGAAFDPEAIARLCAAYELARQKLRGRIDLGAAGDQVIARSVIRLAEAGEQDPERIALSVLQSIGLRGDA